MKWNVSLGRWFGIPVYLHFTFILVMGFLATASGLAGGSLESALGGLAFFAAIFGCVLLHEFGHALMARRYGVATQDITLLPIGGVARLERMPEKPAQEFWVAVAGPAVNVVIAAGLALGLGLTGSFEPLSGLGPVTGNFAERLLAVNVFLVLFNLLPAFPMDGGRVLRSLLAMKYNYARATQIAGRLGQGMAFLFAFVGLLVNPMLLLIALFVWIGATQEMGMVQTRWVLAGLPVREAMVTDFRSVGPEDPLGEVVRLVLAGSQQDFPVTVNGAVVGLLERRHLLDGLTRLGPNGRVSEVMVREFPKLDSGEMVEGVFGRNQPVAYPMLPVVSEGRLIGLLTMDNIAELLLIRSALDSDSAGLGAWDTRKVAAVSTRLAPLRG